MQKRRRYGFTLIELLVVIAIIAILAAILFPVFAQARKKAYEAAGTSNARQASMAIMQYVQDYDEMFPRCGYGSLTAGSSDGQGGTLSVNNTIGIYEWQNVTAPYHKSAGIFLSPGDASSVGSMGTNDATDGHGHPSNESLLYNDIISHDCAVAASGVSDCQGNQNQAQVARSLAAFVSPADCVLLSEGHGGWDKSVGPLPPDWTGSTDKYSKFHLEESISGYQTALIAGNAYTGWGQHTVNTPFYNGTGVVAFADGHVKAIHMADSSGNPLVCATLPWPKNIDPFQRGVDKTTNFCSGAYAPGGPGNWN